jgi:hypothetical protein
MQMTVYLECRERVNKFDTYLRSICPEYMKHDLDIEKDLVDEPRYVIIYISIIYNN